MLQRLVIIALLAAAVYWYWQGPYQTKTNPDYATVLDQNDEKMASCVRSALYRTGTTGVGPDAEGAHENCAREYNLYRHKGRWHSFGMDRPN